jgi:hypothetical protein
MLIEFGVPRKLVELTDVCLNETYSKVCIGKYLSYMFTIQNGLKQGYAFITIALQLCFGVCHQEGPREPGKTEIEWDTLDFGLCQ